MVNFCLMMLTKRMPLTVIFHQLVLLITMLHRTVQACLYLDSIEISDVDVMSAIDKLKSKLSSGPDGLPPFLFKQLSDSLSFSRRLTNPLQLYTQWTCRVFCINMTQYDTAKCKRRCQMPCNTLQSSITMNIHCHLAV